MHLSYIIVNDELKTITDVVTVFVMNRSVMKQPATMAGDAP